MAGRQAGRLARSRVFKAAAAAVFSSSDVSVLLLENLPKIVDECGGQGDESIGLLFTVKGFVGEMR